MPALEGTTTFFAGYEPRQTAGPLPSRAARFARSTYAESTYGSWNFPLLPGNLRRTAARGP